jgi:hypothetical protein
MRTLPRSHTRRTHARAARPAAPPAARPPAPSLAFQGRALDARTGLPVAGARAVLAEPADLLGRLAPPPPGRGRAGLSGADGAFSLAAPLAARWWLLVHHPDYLPELVEVAAGAATAAVRLERAAAIAGRVLDAAGGPLAGVRVRGLCPSAVDVVETESGADGTYRLEGLRPGRWIVLPAEGRAALPDGLGAAVLCLSGGETATAELRASEGRATVRVRPLDARGRPCAAELLLAPPAPRPARTLDELLARGPILASRDARAIPHVPAGHWTLYVVRETGAAEPDINGVPIEVGERDLSLELRLPDGTAGSGLRAI